MNLSTMTQPYLSMMLIEGALALLTLFLCVVWPKFGFRWFSKVERSFGRLARRKSLSVLVIGVTALFLRLAILPLCPIPSPFVPDDFSFLLASDTFAHGRLTNPTPAMWQHFESIHITMNPTYMSMYFPAQGLVLAAGKVLLGNPWFGLLCAMALMCASICWMLQAWLPPGWALLGGFVAILRLGLFSYWINTYTGAGCVSALGGALVLGAFPRIIRIAKFRDCLLLAVGVVLLALSRPYEGFLICIPVLFVLVRWILSAKNRPSAISLARLSTLPLALIVAAALWLGYYDRCAFGNPLTLPYTVDRNTYSVSPYWIWQHPSPEPGYRHKVMRDFYIKGELEVVKNFQTPVGFVTQNINKPLLSAYFFAGITLLPPLIMLPRVILDRRIRFIALSSLVWVPGMFIIIFLLPHYLAPFTAAFYAMGLQCMRHLRVWKPACLPIGLSMVRLTVVSSLLLAAVRLYADPMRISYATWPGRPMWAFDWYGPGDFGADRARMERTLQALPGKQLVLVRYSERHDPVNEWVYNHADLNNSKVIWVRDMDMASNRKIVQFYMDRKVWLVQPDSTPTEISPYQLQAFMPDLGAKAIR